MWILGWQDTQHNGIQHNNKDNTLSLTDTVCWCCVFIDLLNVVMLSAIVCHGAINRMTLKFCLFV
jgi:hypothetical protein